jgi:hypothetical protein
MRSVGRKSLQTGGFRWRKEDCGESPTDAICLLPLVAMIVAIVVIARGIDGDDFELNPSGRLEGFPV